MAEALLFELGDDDQKFRQLPCRTFVSMGVCPYGERCVYVHDPRLEVSHSTPRPVRCRRKNKEDIVLDAFFWPILRSDDVQRDASGQVEVLQEYSVPVPKADKVCTRTCTNTNTHKNMHTS